MNKETETEAAERFRVVDELKKYPDGFFGNTDARLVIGLESAADMNSTWLDGHYYVVDVANGETLLRIGQCDTAGAYMVMRDHQRSFFRGWDGGQRRLKALLRSLLGIDQ